MGYVQEHFPVFASSSRILNQAGSLKVRRMGSAYRVLDRRAKKGFLLRWTFVLASVSFALLVQSDSSNAKVRRGIYRVTMVVRE